MVYYTCNQISIHALLAESDSQQPAGTTSTTYFYPRSPCGERPTVLTLICDVIAISIHALLAESDGGFGVGSWLLVIFLSTLSLRRATQHSEPNSGRIRFLSTLSLRRATYMGVTVLGIQHNFYPRSPCGERRANNQQGQQARHISIHALLAESDFVRIMSVSSG